ncbi:DUF6867 family protein [Hoeflea olei]|uniref:DUF6867 domain-containing protein n=1 Tax=Hoeflea olei TaxID=1480615 RepID=A0A1C1YUR2_9HYPH|nr:hypothetical protein [Hoeflea olei]OCW57167.1 hypothetical protein AWJ14_06925 [Hoeflea olei]
MDQNLLWEVSIAEFVFVTMVLGGSTAWMTGRAVAQTWRTPLQLAGYMVLLSFAVRFIHFALFSGTLLSLHYYLVDFVVILIFAFLGMRFTRAGQITRQYSFAFVRSGPFSWKQKGR